MNYFPYEGFVKASMYTCPMNMSFSSWIVVKRKKKTFSFSFKSGHERLWKKASELCSWHQFNIGQRMTWVHGTSIVYFLYSGMWRDFDWCPHRVTVGSLVYEGIQPSYVDSKLSYRCMTLGSSFANKYILCIMIHKYLCIGYACSLLSMELILQLYGNCDCCLYTR